MTFGLIRFRPSKPKFLVNVKWSVLQYALLKPLLSITAVICEAMHKLCSVSWSFQFASVWLFIADFVSLSIALWGLFTLYVLIAPELKGRRALSKFLSVKIIIALIFYQGLVFSALQSYGYIHETEFWSVAPFRLQSAQLTVVYHTGPRRTSHKASIRSLRPSRWSSSPSFKSTPFPSRNTRVSIPRSLPPHSGALSCTLSTSPTSSLIFGESWCV